MYNIYIFAVLLIYNFIAIESWSLTQRDASIHRSKISLFVTTLSCPTRDPILGPGSRDSFLELTDEETRVYRREHERSDPSGRSHSAGASPPRPLSPAAVRRSSAHRLYDARDRDRANAESVIYKPLTLTSVRGDVDSRTLASNVSCEECFRGRSMTFW